MTAALLIFLLTYLIIAGQKIPYLHVDRPSGALLGAVLMVWSGALSQDEAVAAINFDTILLLLGMMILAGYLAEASFFRWCAYWVVRLARTRRGLLLGVVSVSGLLSALFVNDTVCLVLTPLLLQVCDETGIEPVPVLLALATAANIGSVATLTGNPQNMIVGTHSAWSYPGFAWHMLPVAVGALALDWGYLRWAFRRSLGSGRFERPASPPAVDAPLLIKGGLVAAFVLAGFLAAAAWLERPWPEQPVMILAGRRPPARVLARVDWSLLLFFGGLFVVVEGLNGRAGEAHSSRTAAPYLGQETGTAVGRLLRGSPWCCSNMVSNVPMVLVAVPWVERFADPPVFWLALAMASTFAGNLTLGGLGGQRHRGRDGAGPGDPAVPGLPGRRGPRDPPLDGLGGRRAVVLHGLPLNPVCLEGRVEHLGPVDRSGRSLASPVPEEGLHALGESPVQGLRVPGLEVEVDDHPVAPSQPAPGVPQGQHGGVDPAAEPGRQTVERTGWGRGDADDGAVRETETVPGRHVTQFQDLLRGSGRTGLLALLSVGRRRRAEP